MTNLDKQQIAKKLAEYCERYDSQQKAANSLRGVSSATISHMLNGKWDKIKVQMWKNVASQIGYSANEWKTVEIRDFRLLNKLLTDARDNSQVFAVTGDAGTGKTFALRSFAKEHKYVYRLSCNEFWNRKMFLQELLTAMGKDYTGYTVGEMVYQVIKTLKTLPEPPEIIMDEADKLSDQVLYFFITIYNQLEDDFGDMHCGLVLIATSHLEKRINKGIKLNKKGYTEIFSRMGRKFIELKGVGFSDVKGICEANGVTNASAIKEIWEDCEGDLRRVKRKIHAFKNSNRA